MVVAVFVAVAAVPVVLFAAPEIEFVGHENSAVAESLVHLENSHSGC